MRGLLCWPADNGRGANSRNLAPWAVSSAVHSRVYAVVAGAYAHAVDAADLADVVEMHCSKRERKEERRHLARMRDD